MSSNNGVNIDKYVGARHPVVSVVLCIWTSFGFLCWSPSVKIEASLMSMRGIFSCGHRYVCLKFT